MHDGGAVVVWPGMLIPKSHIYKSYGEQPPLFSDYCAVLIFRLLAVLTPSFLIASLQRKLEIRRPYRRACRPGGPDAAIMPGAGLLPDHKLPPREPVRECKGRPGGRRSGSPTCNSSHLYARSSSRSASFPHAKAGRSHLLFHRHWSAQRRQPGFPLSGVVRRRGPSERAGDMARVRSI